MRNVRAVRPATGGRRAWFAVAALAAVMAGVLVIDRAPDPRRVVEAAAADWNAGDLEAMLRHYTPTASVLMYGRPDDPFVVDTLGYWFALGDRVTLSGVAMEGGRVRATFSHTCRYLEAAGIELGARGWFRMEGDRIAASFDQSFASDALSVLERQFIAWIRLEHPDLLPLVYEPDTYLGIEWDVAAAQVRLDHMDAFFADRAVTP